MLVSAVWEANGVLSLVRPRHAFGEVCGKASSGAVDRSQPTDSCGVDVGGPVGTPLCALVLWRLDCGTVLS